MKTYTRYLGLILLLCLVLCSCSREARWQEKYDTGLKYLSEGNYEQAALAFTAAIEIDGNNAQAFVARGDAYLGLGDPVSARADYDRAMEIDPGLDLTEQYESLATLENDLLLEELKTSLKDVVDGISVTLTVDNIVLGQSGIEEAKSAYQSRPYAYSNLMNDDTQDTVYTVYGMNGYPIPEGYSENEFGFLFAAPADGGPISHITIAEPGFTCLGALRAGDPMETALEFLGFPGDLPTGEIEWDRSDGSTFTYTCDEPGRIAFKCEMATSWYDIRLENGIIHSISMDLR